MSSLCIDTPPEMNGNDISPKYYTETNTPVTVFPNFTITDADGDDIKGLVIVFTSGYSENEDILSFTTQNGISGTFDKVNGALILSGSASPSNYQTAVQSITYTNDAAPGSASYAQREFTISFANSDYSPSTGHFYEFINSTLYWDAAKTAASAKTYYGLQGYLATVTSAEENSFVKSKISSYDTWLAGSDAASEGSWLWVTGPEAGNQFSSISVAYNGSYVNWKSGEPNNTGDAENCLLMNSSDGSWNDGGNNTSLGYTVEYGGMAGDPTINMTTTTTLNVVAPQPPVINGNNDSPTYNTSEYNPVIVFPNFTVTDAEESNIKGLTIHFSSGYQSNQDTLLFTNTSKITGSFDDTQGALVLLGDASPLEYQNAMRSITYVNNAPLFGLIDGSQREFTISLANADYFSQDGSLDNGHFYENVNTSVTWTEAKAAASAKTYYGLQGYLCTVTSAAENNFILGIQDDTDDVLWLGGLDSETNGTWKWVTGPESGEQFSTGATAFNGSYVNWNAGQPSGGEYCLQFFTNKSVYTAGTWNDRLNTSPCAYIVEYGGMTGDPTINMTTTTTLNIDVVRPKAPGGVIDNLRVWFNANSGTTNGGNTITNGDIGSWEGQKPYGVNTTTVNDVAGDPAVVSNSANFNAAVSFDGDDAIRTSATSPYTTYFNSTTDENTIFLVKKSTAGKVEVGYGYDNGGEHDRAGYFERANGYQRADYGNNVTTLVGSTTMIDKYVIARQDVQPGDLFLYLDGALEKQTSPFNSLAGSSDGYLGFGASPYDLSSFSTTDIVEYIIYASDLSATEIKEVESYLALKYGITLNQTTATNYLASDGTVIWSANDNAGYTTDIFGIGRDDASGLNQKVSKSVNAGSILTIALNEDFNSANNDAGRTTHANDLQFLTVANNGAVLTPQVTELDATTGFNIRLAREWKVDATNFAQNISMKFEGYDEDWSIIATSDGDFSSNVTTVGTLNADGEFTTTAAPADGTVFTLAKYQEAPGGVTNGISLWIKANNQVFSDLGITGATNNNTIEQWNDQSPYGNHFTQVNTEKPTFLENSLNFNPQVYFNGTKAMNGVSMTGLPSGSDARLMRVVATQTAAFTGNHVLFAHGTATDGQAHGIAGSLSDNSLLYGSWGGGNSILSSNSWTLNKPHIIGGGFDGSSTTYLQADGATLTTDADGAPPTWNTVNSRMCIGADIADETGEFWIGNIAEVVVYSANVSASDQQKIDSYLALKYGITLNQTSATNYLSSAGSVVWDGTANASYKTDIFGIGRDDASGLNQKVSRSVNSGNSPVLATNADFTSSNSDAGRTTSLDDGNFMLMGHNNGTENSFTSSFNGGTNNRSDRVYKVEETGTVGEVYFAIPKTAITFPSGIPVLVASNDLTFNSSDDIVNLADDGTYYWASINPDNGAYLAFASTTPGFTVSETTLTIDENAGTGTFTVVLDVQPSNDVVFDVASDKTEEATVDKATLTFTSANWDTPQTVTVTGVDDDIDRDDTATITVMVKDASSDDPFDALTDQTAGITLTDDDTAGFTVSKIALTIDENAGTGSFTVVLNSEPTSDVVFDVTSDKTDEATIDKSTLTFTSANWDTSQTVTVTGVDDDIDRDDTATITVAVKDASSDDTFDALTDQTVGITLTDDDVAPTVSTSAVSSITSSSVTMGGDMSDKGSADVTETGVVYSSINASPEIGGADVTQDSNGAATGIFSETIGSLAPNTTYNFQAYAINSAGTSYGGVQSFTTKQTQTITFNSLSDKAYGNSDFDPSATASSGLTVSYSSSNTSVATIVAGKIHIVGVGSCTIYADQAGDDTYDVAAQVSQGLNITQKAITVTADAGQTKVYGGADPTFTYTASSALESGDSFSGVLSRATGEDVGSYAITIGTLSAGSNYDLTFVSKDFSITQKEITVTVDAGQTKVYGGADPTFTYTASSALESGDSFSGVLSRTSGESVGSYAILQGTLSAGSNYDLTFLSKAFSITQKAITVTVDAGQTKVYGDADPAFTYTASSALESGDSFSGVLSRTSGESVGSYAITIGTLSAGSNYDLTFVSKDFSITQKAITVTVDAGQTKVYGDADPTFTYTTSATLESGDSFTGALSRGTGEDVGSYAITIGTLSAGSNYDLTFVSKAFSITQKAITVTVDAGQTKVYGGADPTFTYTTSSALESGDSFTGVLSRATGEDVGSYAITIGTLSAGSNYDLTFVSKAFSITQKAITVTADAGQTKVYGGADPTFTYTTSSALESGDSFSGVLSRATGEDVGSYAITIGTLSAGSNYDLTFVSKAFSITQKEITVTVDAGQTKVYGGADPTFTYTTSATLESGDSFTGALSRATGEDVGSYAITIGTLSAGSNYDLTFVSKDFSITQKAITVTVDAGQTKVYGGADPTFTYTTSATLESGDSFSGVLSRTSGESVGSYAILQGTLSAGSNYDLTFVSKDFAVTQKQITITADAGQTKVYGDADPTFTYTTSATLESGDSFSGVLSRTSGEDVGSYAITIGTLSAGSNYDLTFVSKDFSITQKAITVTVDAGQTKVYGQADPTLTYTTSATLESGDSFTGVLSRTSGESVGSYAILQGTLSAGSNYDLTFVSKDFAVTQKQITITADAGQTKVYGDADPTFTYTTSATLESGDSFSGVLSRTSGEDVGSYAITIGTLSAGSNYDLTFVSKAFSITQKAITVTVDAGQTKVYGDADPTFTYTTSATLESGDSFTGALSRGTGEDVGSYAITIGTLSAGSNYDLTFVSKAFSITQKAITVTVDAGQTKVYGGADPTFTYTTSATLESGDSFTGVLSRTSGESVGSYAILQGTLSAGSNYDLTFVSKDFAVTQKQITITADAGQTKVYGDADPTFTYTTSATLESGDSFSGVLSRTSGEDAGSYAITIGTLSAGSNYDLTFVSKDFAVTQKQITVTADAGQTKVYGDADPTFTYTTSATLESGDSFTGVLSRTSGESVGSYAILQGTLSAGSNYDLTFVSKDFSITQKSLTVTAENKTKEYDGAVFTGFTVTYSGFITGEDETDLSGTLVYSGSATTATNVGTGYVITPGGLTSSNYVITFADGSLDITLKVLTITAEDKSKEYDGAVYSGFTVTYAGFRIGEDETDLSGTLAFTGTASTAINVGTGYVITPGGLTSSNYHIIFADGSLDITQKAITVTADAGQTKVYGDADPAFTYTASAALESGDSFSGVLSRATGEDVGSYAITIGTLSAGSNYDLTFVSKDFSITQKAITVTADAGQTKVYGGADPTFTYTTSSALESGDSFSGVLSRTSGESVGSYAILQGTLSAGSNYDLTFVSKAFSITQKAITVTADAGQTKVYGDANPAFTYTTSATLESGDSFTGALSRATGESVGSYAILQGTLSAGSNYDLTFVSKDFAVTQKQITVTADAGQTKVYGDADPTFTYTASSALESGDSFSGVLSRATGEDVGSYAITIGTLSAGSNYDLTFVSKDFSITQKAITVTADAGQTKVYGDADPTFTYTTSATLESGDSFTGVLSRTSGESVGSYAILQGTLSAGSNYDLTFVSKDFAVTQKQITITADAGQTKVYGDADPTFTYTTSATLESGDSFTGVLSRTSGESVGSYAILQGTLSAGSNYDLTFVSKDFSITQKSLTVTAENKTKEYDGAVFTGFTVTYSGFITGEDETDLSGTLVYSGSATTATNVGTGYVITPGGLTSSNYAITFADGSLDITIASQTIIFNPLGTKVYGDAPFTISATGGISGNPVVFISSDQNVAVCSGVNGEIVNIIGVGTCMINANQAGNSNFNPAIQVSQILTVNKYIAGDTDGDGVITDPEIAGDTDGDGVITDPEIAGDIDGDGVISDPELAGDTDGDGVITDPEIAGDTDGDGVITDPEIAGDTDGDGVITDPEIAGDTDGDGVITDPEIAGDTDGDGVITDPEIAGDTNGDGVIIDPEIAGDTDGDGVITDPEIAGDIDGDGVITDPEIAGDIDGDGVISDPELAGDTDGDGVITDPEIAGDTDGDGVITDPEIAGDTDGDGVITDPEIAGDTDGDGVITDPEIAGDTDGDGVITDPEIAGDTNGDGVIIDPEIAGDTDGDGVITDPEIAGDIDGDGVITDPEIAGDTDGNGTIDDSEFAGDTDGDGVITDPEIAGDIDGDGVISDPELAGDTDGDGVITDPEIAGDTDGDGVITDPEIAGDTDGDGVITDPEIAGDTDGDGVITAPEIAGDTNGDGVIDDSESTEITLDLVNDVDNPLSLCDDTEVELAYTGLIGNPSQYRIAFEESASTAGFHDIDYTDILSDSRVFRFSVPVGVPDGLYEGNLQLRNNFGVESVMYKFQFIVNVSAEYIISKYDDVVLCDNSSERFAAYQWYKDGVAIPGAVNQFYNDPDGLVGSYSLDLITIDGQHLTTCSKEFNIPLNKSISVYPNPISSNGKCTVRMNGFEEDELLGSQLSIFNSFGAKVFYTEDVIKENVLLLQLKNGVYVGNVTTETGSKYSFKILIQK
ncbi:MBG domain-containing protein [Labilibaculum euxinus]